MDNLAVCRVSRKREGFTMVEVVVSAAVLAIVSVAMISAISTAQRIQAVTESRLANLHIARQNLEAFSRLSYDSDELEVGTAALPGNKGTCVISEDSGVRNKNVTLSLRWVDPIGATQMLSFATSFSRSLHR